jgi:large subunit ribosomal protein L10
MSKYVKNLISDDLRSRLQGVDGALLVNMVGLSASTSNRLRAELRQKNIHVMVVKNSLAARAAEGTPLAPMFVGLGGTAAVCWGSTDIINLAKEVTRLSRDDKFAPFAPLGGLLDGEKLSSAQVVEVSKWPTREEVLGMLVGQILGPGGRLASQLTAMGGALASQIEESGKLKEEAAPEGGEAPDAAPAAEPVAEPAA